MTILSMDREDYAMRSEFLTTLNKFFLGSASLTDLQDWLLSNLQTILDSGDSLAIEAANELDSDLVQLGEELIDENVVLEHIELWIERLQTISAALNIGESLVANAQTIVGANTQTLNFEMGPMVPAQTDLRVALSFG